MAVLRLVAAALAFVGRHGTIAIALSIFAGLAIPPLAAAFRPILTETIFVLLLLAFLRVRPSALSGLARKPGLVIAAAVWMMLAIPLALASTFHAFGFEFAMPELYLILILQLCAPSLMGSPALAALIGLDVALTLATLVVCTAITPLTATLFGHFFIGTSLISPIEFGVRLFALIAGSAAAAAAIRYAAGDDRLDAQRDAIDGLSVLGMFIFAAAAMDGVIAHTIASPKLVGGLTALTFALTLGTVALTTLAFLPAGRKRAFAIGILAGNRNIGLMLAATGFAIPDLAWLYFGLAQFPIYLLPVLLKPLARRLENKR
ncbi:MAG: sodium:proton symporter [Pseudolabrys sp.]